MPGEKRFSPFWLWMGAGLVVLVLFAVVYFVLPHVLVTETGRGSGSLERHQILKAENDVRTSGIQVLAGLVLLLGTALTAYHAARTLRMTRDGQLTERFSAAVDQLGNADSDVKVGGVHALARVAYFSSHDQGPIFEILTAHLRAKHRVPRKRRYGAARGSPPRVVQAIATATATRNPRQRSKRQRLDLSGVDLARTSMVSADLENANLAEADLSGARLEKANLRGANLRNARLDRATLTGADLRGAQLSGASANYAYLDQCRLERADLTDTQLEGANLQGSRGARHSEALTTLNARLP